MANSPTPPRGWRRRPAAGRTVAATAVLSIAASAAAQDVGPNLDVYGYGTSAYGDTDGNNYQFGDDDGSYDNTQLAIGFAAQWERMRVATQVEWETSGRFDGTRSEVDFAFAEWRFDDRLRLRLGQAKHPFGLYAELLDAGTVRPFLTLPVGVYGPTGAVAEHYTGVGVTGFYAAGDWELSYDLYVGEVVLDAAHPWEALEKIGFREDEQLRVSDLVGGRLVVASPLPGLSFGFSVHRGTAEPEREEGEEDEGGEEGEEGEAPAEQRLHVELGGEGEEGEEGVGDISATHATYGVQAEYLGPELLIRTEAVRHEFEGRHDIDAYYLELAYRLTANWQVAGRYDWADVELAKARAAREVGQRAPTLLEHEDIGIGLNYWFSDDLVVKLSYHAVEGNFFARPIRGGVREAVTAGTLDKDTDLIQLGVNFSF